MISKNTIDQVFDTARVEEVIGDFVQLKKSGSNYKGLSPFSDERTPSFMVSPVKQIWKDFSSGKGGNVVAFLMEHEHFTYPEAIKYLAKKYGIEIEETQQTNEEKEAASVRESLYLVNEFARDYFVKNVFNDPKGIAIGQTYFKERGFTVDTIKKFQLGYALDQWDAFTQEALKNGYQLSYLENTGLTIVKGDASTNEATKQIDRFKGRVIFPIHSLSGRVLGFGGRILTQDKKSAKYLNSPESEVYQKSKVLYGIYFAKQAIVKEDNCYLVEGYTDVIQLQQKGIQNVVSSSGTALTQEQVRLIQRLSKNITLLFDGDAAGLRASLRGVDIILEQGLNVKICTFPQGEDPDSFAKNNDLEALQEYLATQAKDFIAFKASILAQEAKNDPVAKADTVREMVASIAKIPDAIKQEIYIKECSSIMQVSEEVLFSTLAQILQKEKREAAKRKPNENIAFEVVAKQLPEINKVDAQVELEQKIIQLLLLYGAEETTFEEVFIDKDEEGNATTKKQWVNAKVFEKIYLDLQEDEIEFTQPHFQTLYNAIVTELHQTHTLKIETFINTLPQNASQMVSNILMEEEKYQLHQWDRKDIYVKDKKDALSQIVTETIISLRRNLVNKKIEELGNLVSQEDQAVKKEELLKTIIDYNTLKKTLSVKLNRVL